MLRINKLALLDNILKKQENAPLKKRLNGKSPFLIVEQDLLGFKTTIPQLNGRNVDVRIPKKYLSRVKDFIYKYTGSGKRKYIKRKLKIIYYLPKNKSSNYVIIPLPMNNPNQKVLQEKINAGTGKVKKINKKNGERYAIITNPTENITIDLIIKQKEIGKYSDKQTKPKRYLQNEEKIEAKNPQIMSLAQGITKGSRTSAQKARQIFEWIKFNVKYPKNWENYQKTRTEQDFGALGALKKVGDCGAQSGLFVAMCRSLGIPAREQIGVWGITGKNQQHVWAEFYDKKIKKWVPVDISAEQILDMKGFGVAEDLRITFSITPNPKIQGFQLPTMQCGLAFSKKPSEKVTFSDLKKRKIKPLDIDVICEGIL